MSFASMKWALLSLLWASSPSNSCWAFLGTSTRIVPSSPSSQSIVGGGRHHHGRSPSSVNCPVDDRAPFASTTTKTRLYMSTRNQTGRDFYAILGVSRSADAAEIKKAYRRLAKQYHPDSNPGQDTTEKFQEINRAYEVLNNPDLKKKYDMFGEQGLGTSAASDAAAGSSPFGGGFGQEVDLGDIFDSFFGGGGMGGRGGGGSIWKSISKLPSLVERKRSAFDIWRLVGRVLGVVSSLAVRCRRAACAVAVA